MPDTPRRTTPQRQAQSSTHDAPHPLPANTPDASYLTTDQFFSNLHHDFAAARRHIALAFFTVSLRPNKQHNHAARLFELLAVRAASRVRVTLLIPPFRHVQSNRRAVADLADTLIQIRTPPDDTPLHAKLAIIDSRVLYISSHNLARRSFSRNIEAAARITNPADIARAHTDYMRWWHMSRPVNHEVR